MKSMISWIRVAVFMTATGIFAHGPIRYARLHSLIGPHLGSATPFGDGPWSDPRALSVVGFILAVFVLSCAQSTRYREILISIVAVSITMFPLTLAILFGGVMGVALATPFIFVFSKLISGFRYYIPTMTDAEQNPPPLPRAPRTGHSDGEG